MFIVLVGPKGSGKSHIGRTLQRHMGVHFFHVERLWMRYYAECRDAAREPSIAEGIARVHPRIVDTFGTHEHVCVETTGASPEILGDLLSLAPSSKTLVARVAAPLELCLERIALRNQCNQIPMDVETIRMVYALSSAATVPTDLTLQNKGLGEGEIVSMFRNALN
jgi:shikimate kinase